METDVGIPLAPSSCMIRQSLCDHCERVLADRAYRVVSEDGAGGMLLNMRVCGPCHLKAQELGLETCEDEPEQSLYGDDNRC